MGTSSYLFLLLLCFLSAKGTEGASKVITKFTSQFRLIWTDKNSGSKSDVSVWHPLDLEAGFYALGDTAVSGYSKPTNDAVLVKDTGDDLVKAPKSFNEIWADVGSGAVHDVSFYQMVPESGYTCLGHIAVNGRNEKPKAELYRCVKSGLVQPGFLYPIWNDKNSGAKADVSLWNVQNDRANTTGVWAQTFLSVKSHNKPTEKPYLLNSKHATISQYADSEDVAIVLYQTNDVVKVWSDNGSGAKKDVSIWKAFHCCSLGYTAVANYREPFGVYAKEKKPGALAKPKGFTKVWDDKGSGANLNVAIWFLECPVNYIALGCAATDSHSTQPSVDDLRCVHKNYVLPAKWTKIWEDVGSGAKDDLSIWEATPLNTSGQSIVAMSAVKLHGEMLFPAYVLKSANARVQTNKPAKKAIIYGVEYMFKDRKIAQVEPIDLAARTIINNCKGVVNGPALSASRQLTYSVTDESSWSYDIGVEIGITVEMSAGIPEVFEAKASQSITSSFNSGQAGSHSETNTDSLTATLTANPGYSESYFVTGKKYCMDIPWRGKLKTIFEDGKDQVDEIKGLYQGVHVSEFTVSADAPQKCN